MTTRARRAFSYIRFSSPQQAQGGSLSRQASLSLAYCERKGLTLDDTLTLHDLGVSAFRGDNVREGALAAFLEGCRTGRIPSGSVLIVESLDRLSRDQIRPALQLFLALQDFGITIVTLAPEREYPPSATDALALIEPLIVFARAHEESAMKSHRRRDGWKQAKDRARKGGGPMMKTCPAWLEVTPEGFAVKEEAAEAVRRIYAMARDGLGVHRICERLARDKVQPIGSKGRWVKAYVYRILNSPAAMGTYQPQKQEGKKSIPDGEPIPGHYPAVVEEEVWHAAQAAIQGRAGEFGSGGKFKKGGKASPAAGRKGAEETNLFTGLLRHATNGEAMHIVHGLGRKGEGERRKYVYLVPTRETACPGGGRIDYEVFESAVLSLLKEVRPADIATEPERSNGRRAEITALSGRLLDIDSKLEKAKQRARGAGDFDALLDIIADLQGERKEVSERRAELEAEEESRAPADLGETQSLIGLLADAAAEEREDLRRRLKGRIRQLVSSAGLLIARRGRTCFAALQLWFRGGDRHRDYLIVHRAGNRYEAGGWWSRSVKRDGDVLDLRKPEDAERLEAVLNLPALEPKGPPYANLADAIDNGFARSDNPILKAMAAASRSQDRQARAWLRTMLDADTAKSA
jgi:DNA invertase Pin-like site-specific DNA recombinase